MNKPKFLFGDIVVVNNQQIGVIVKTMYSTWSEKNYYKIYNRMTEKINEYWEEDVERYRVRHKYLNEEEMEWRNG